MKSSNTSHNLKRNSSNITKMKPSGNVPPHNKNPTIPSKVPKLSSSGDTKSRRGWKNRKDMKNSADTTVLKKGQSIRSKPTIDLRATLNT
jgi:hypothetical protein